MIASLTWSFAVEWVAQRLGVSRVLGTRLEPDGQVRHVWPRDKAGWLQEVTAKLGVSPDRVAAVGDSASDAEFLSAASLRFFVGASPLTSIAEVCHRPHGNLENIAHEILGSWRV